MLEQLISQTELSPESHRRVLTTEEGVQAVVAESLGPATSTGSSVRGTYLPGPGGMPKDFDLRVLDTEDRELPELEMALAEQQGRMEAVLSNAYGRPISLTTERAWERDGVFKQIQLAAEDATTHEPLVGIDLNFDTEPHETAAYNTVFWQQMGHAVSGLPPEEQRAGAEWVLANIRALKQALKEGNVYDSSDGGFGGVGSEQLILQLHDGEPATSLGELRDIYNVGNALRTAAGKPFELYHPTTFSELADEKLSRHGGKGYRRLQRLARRADAYVPRQ